MSKALLVVDMQNICVGMNHHKFFQYDQDKLIACVNAAIRENERHAIIYIKNIMKDNLINRFAPFKAFDGTPNVELVESMHIESDYIYKKYSGNAFTNPDLKAKLDELDVNEIEIVGVDGGGCIALTAFGAVKAGYKVVINTKAVGTMFHRKAARYNKRLMKLGVKFL